MARSKKEHVEEAVEEEIPFYDPPKQEPKKEKLIKVTAVSWYSNGDTETNWHRGETRYLPGWKVNRIEKDLPGNWIYG